MWPTASIPHQPLRDQKEISATHPLFEHCLHCYLNNKQKHMRSFCDLSPKNWPIYVYFNIIRNNMNSVVAAAAVDAWIRLPCLRKAQLHIQEGQCYFAAFSP